MSQSSNEQPTLSPYKSDDRELLFDVYNRFLFKPVLSIIPRWVHPNHLSVLGICCSISAVVAAFYATQGHRWLFLVVGFLVVAQQTFDNVDGPLARKTNRASAVGELLDHGFDGVSAGAVLVTGVMLIGIHGGWLLALACLGSLGFISLMSEQYHTGTLIIPAFSGTEGITIIAALCLIAFFADDPAWLHVDTSHFNLGFGILLFALGGYAVAIIPPILRIFRAGKRPYELLPVLPFLLTLSIYSLAGNNGLVPAMMAQVFAARMGVRFIQNRHTGKPVPLLNASDWLPYLTLIPLAMGTWTANRSVTVAILILSAFYITDLVRAARYLLAAERAAGARAPA